MITKTNRVLHFAVESKNKLCLTAPVHRQPVQSIRHLTPILNSDRTIQLVSKIDLA